jgi:hypothetical protein
MLGPGQPVAVDDAARASVDGVAGRGRGGHRGRVMRMAARGGARWWACGLVGVAAVVLAPGRASASQCVETPFAVQADAADVIFAGRALAMDAELATTFEVERVYKGTVPARVVVETLRVKYAALSPPDRWLVLADADEPSVRPGNLFVHTCSGSRRAPWPEAVSRRLGKGRAPSGTPTAEALGAAPGEAAGGEGSGGGKSGGEAAGGDAAGGSAAAGGEGSGGGKSGGGAAGGDVVTGGGKSGGDAAGGDAVTGGGSGGGKSGGGAAGGDAVAGGGSGGRSGGGAASGDAAADGREAPPPAGRRAGACELGGAGGAWWWVLVVGRRRRRGRTGPSSSPRAQPGGWKQEIVVSMRKFDSEVWRSAKKKSIG